MQICGNIDCGDPATMVVTYQFPGEVAHDIVRCKQHAKRVIIKSHYDNTTYQVVKHRKICPNE